MRYVALLRGVNVGGKNKVAMSELRSLFVGLGYENVSTYINSGNVIFEAAEQPEPSSISSAIKRHFGFVVDVLIFSGEQISAIADTIPDDWTNDSPNPGKSGYKSDVLYLFGDVDSPDILDKIGYRPDVETMLYIPGAVLANVSRKNQSRYSLLKLAGTPLYKRITIRNITTARKLARLITEE